MKKVLIVLCLFISSVVCVAQTPAVAYAGLQTTTFSANGSSVGLNETQSGANFHQVTWTTSGTVSTCQVRVDSSANGISWNSGDIITNQTCTSNGNFTSSSFTANFVRVTVSSLTGGGSIAVVYTAYMNTPVGVGNCTYNSSTNTLKCTNILVGVGTPNSSTGTTTGLGAEYINTAGVFQLQTANTTNTTTPSWPVVAQSTCTSPPCTTGNAYVQSTPGSTIAVQLDNTCTGPDINGAGAHYVVRSIITPGKYHDTGSSVAPTSGSITGRCLTSGTTTQSIVLEPQLAGGAGGGSVSGIGAYCALTPMLACLSASVAPSSGGANDLVLTAFPFYGSQTFTHFEAYLSAISASATPQTCDVAIYDNTGTKITSLGGVECGTGTGTVGIKVTNGSFTLNNNTYWVGACATTTDAKFQGTGLTTSSGAALSTQTQKLTGRIVGGCTAGVTPASFTPASVATFNPNMPTPVFLP